MHNMESSPEQDNFVKLSYILLNIVAQHFREYFVKLWDKKYPNEKWHDDVAKRNLKLQSMLVSRDGRQKQDMYSQKILKGDEQNWDISTLIRAILDSGFKLLEGCRPPDERTSPLRESEEIEIIRRIRNEDYGHITSMSCSLDAFMDIMTEIRSVAKNLFGKDVEKKIYKIEMSPSTQSMREQVHELKSRVEDLERHGVLKPYTEKDIDDLKARYKTKYQKHEIHKVNCNGKITLEEVDVEEFAVKLTMSDSREPAMETFRGETERFLRQLEGMRESEIKMSDLIDSKNRITRINAVAGAGKSVLVKQLVYKWANGELFKEFTLCITFECRELNYFVQNEGKKFEKHELLHEFVKTIFNFDIQNAKKLLVIADGYDEIFDFKETDSIICQLLDFHKTKYPHAKIIITGRPHVENMLVKHGRKSMGGLRKVEICGLRDEQIEKFIHKFASDNDDIIAKINMAKDYSQINLNLLHIPQMLQSFCCVVMLPEFNGVKNAAELYCWSFLLLLRQHAEKDGSSEKKLPQIFSEYSKDLLKLSEICHELLNKNTIIFEGDIEYNHDGKGKEFLEGLFVDVSDNFKTRKQFKHLTFMEFFSAVYVCTVENPTEVIKYILKNKMYQVLLFNCQLMSGLSYDGIIKEMFTNTAKLKETNCKHFFENVLKLVRECVIERGGELFKLSIDVIMCLMGSNVIDKQFVLSIINQLNFKGVSYSSRTLIEMIESLIRNFECDDFELKKACENVRFEYFQVNEWNELRFAKYFASCDEIGLKGKVRNVTTTVSDIRKGIDEINEWVECKWVHIWYCKLQGEEFDYDITKCSTLKFLHIAKCNVNKNSFKNLCKWIIASSVEEFRLSFIKDIKVEWWNVLLDAIMNAKEKNDGDMALKGLWMWGCTFMNDETKEKVRAFILIHDYSSFIIICT